MSESARSSRKECAGLVAGQAVLIAERSRLGCLPESSDNAPERFIAGSPSPPARLCGHATYYSRTIEPPWYIVILKFLAPTLRLL